MDVDLKQYSNYKIGGRARQFCNPKNVEALKEAVLKARKDKLPIFILGGGTNLLISDKGFDGLVLKPEMNKLQVSSYKLQVGAGVLMEDLLDFTIAKGLSGFEWAGGLPGTVGGAIRGNAGAFAGETKDNIYEVTSLDIYSKIPKVVKRNNTECKFGYRNSIFKMSDGNPSTGSGQVPSTGSGQVPSTGSGQVPSTGSGQVPSTGSTGSPQAGSGPREVIIEAVFKMKKGDKKAIRSAIEEKIAYRKARQPLEYPNIGSIFKNVDLRLVPKKLHAELAHVVKTDPFPVVPTAHLISECGLKGVSWGGAMISPKHPNFIVNVLDAKAEDVKTLIKLVKAGVKEKFDIKLEEEVIYVE